MKTCGVCDSATIKTRQVILDFDMISKIITFEQKGKYGKEKHQNLGVKVKVVSNMVCYEVFEILENLRVCYGKHNGNKLCWFVDM